MIYGYVISCGDLSLMRVNHLTYSEMSPLVLKERPYKLYVNYGEEARYPRRLPSGRIGEGIQRLVIHWRLRTQVTQAVLALQLDPLHLRYRCVVHMYLNGVHLITASDMKALGTLVVFSKVIFQIHRISLHGSLVSVDGDDPLWALLQEEIQSSLGRGSHKESKQGWSLWFRPRERRPWSEKGSMDGLWKGNVYKYDEDGV